MRRLLLLIGILFLLSSCDDYMNIKTTIDDIRFLAKKKYNLETFGSGVAAPGVIKNFRLTFITKSPLNENEARKLIVEFTEDYISLINNNPKVKQHFETQPINEKHAYFLISIKDKNGNQCKELSAVELGNGLISFCKYDPKQNSFIDLFKEPYSEAYFKVYGTQPPERN